jgi:hypothetical protein
MNLMPLNGMRVRLERSSDMPLDNYCTTLAVIRVEEGASRAEVRCAICGRHRCWLSAEVAKWMLTILKHFPATSSLYRTPMKIESMTASKTPTVMIYGAGLGRRCKSDMSMLTESLSTSCQTFLTVSPT